MSNSVRDQKLKMEFIDYLIANPELRFWQALRNFSGHAGVGVTEDFKEWEDTYYWEDRK